MKGFQPDCVCLKIPAMIVMVLLLLTGGAVQALAGGWFKAAAGMSGMAMDDINNADFRFYDNTPDGYDFPDLDSGFSLSFHLGYDLSRDFSLGFSWDRQYARAEGVDQDITANLNLDANFFMGHLYWRPLRTEKWQFGAAAGMGLVFPDGKVKMTGPGNVNYGEGEITGSSGLALEIMGLVDFSVGERSIIEVTVGWRDATIKKFNVEGRPVWKEDGSDMSLDYTGYIVKAGYKYIFGD